MLSVLIIVLRGDYVAGQSFGAGARQVIFIFCLRVLRSPRVGLEPGRSELWSSLRGLRARLCCCWCDFRSGSHVGPYAAGIAVAALISGSCRVRLSKRRAAVAAVWLREFVDALDQEPKRWPTKSLDNPHIGTQPGDFKLPRGGVSGRLTRHVPAINSSAARLEAFNGSFGFGPC
jgi:hypothetical protein